MKRKLFACFLAWTMILSLAAFGGSGNKAASSATTADAAPAETEEGALKPEEFISFGVTQKTMSQFLWTGWAPLETYQSKRPSTRWF